MIGIGIDIVENCRINKLYQKFGNKFLEKILTQEEREIFIRKSNKVEFISGRLSAKEAFFKATNKKFVSFQDIGIINDRNGIPFVIIKNKNINYKTISVSISHSSTHTVAVCVIEY
ncbi:MAG: holo-ACP synthase [Planctomycetota bacterium]